MRARLKNNDIGWKKMSVGVILSRLERVRDCEVLSCICRTFTFERLFNERSMSNRLAGKISPANLTFERENWRSTVFVKRWNGYIKPFKRQID